MYSGLIDNNFVSQIEKENKSMCDLLTVNKKNFTFT